MRVPRSLSSKTLFLALSLLGTAACSSEEKVDPIAPPTDGDTSSSSSTGAGGGPTAKRQVFERNPLGGPPGNLLADGDFERSIVPEYYVGGQYGWLAFSQAGAQSALVGETGGLCKSGLRCARVAKNAVLFGRGAAAPDEMPHRASIWLKPLEDFAPSGAESPCDFATGYVIECDSFDIAKELVSPDAPDADGWCEHKAEVPGSKVGYCVYLETSVDTLADAASLLPAPDLVMTRSRFQAPDDLAARLAAARGWVRARIGAKPRPTEDDSEPRGLGLR